jgi:hypothetical protein
MNDSFQVTESPVRDGWWGVNERLYVWQRKTSPPRVSRISPLALVCAATAFRQQRGASERPAAVLARAVRERDVTAAAVTVEAMMAEDAAGAEDVAEVLTVIAAAAMAGPGGGTVSREWAATWAPDAASVHWELTVTSEAGFEVMREPTACPLPGPFPRNWLLETLGLAPVAGKGWHPGQGGSFACPVVATSRKREKALLKALAQHPGVAGDH